jgi:hypothetical protein
VKVIGSTIIDPILFEPGHQPDSGAHIPSGESLKESHGRPTCLKTVQERSVDTSRRGSEIDKQANESHRIYIRESLEVLYIAVKIIFCPRTTLVLYIKFAFVRNE